nr:unnamed protein product [Callosobruchus analis]
MQVSEPNNVKIYNLSAGKSLPEWLSERKRRALLKSNVDIRRRIELIQDFDMPGVSTTIKVSRDGQYVLATGIYKPRVKCFDVNNLSLKFERCFDSEAVTFEILSDDYSKLVFLQCDRYIEFHAAYGRHYRLRIPKFGRDMQYHFPGCDLFIVGASSDIYRLNLERGQFLSPYSSKASAINKCTINPIHHLLICGTDEGKIEAWDPRSKNMVATLDCAFNCITENRELNRFPSITALKFNGGLQLGVGTATGQVLLYDIRSNKPFYVKDHMYEQPIKDIEFHYQQDLVFSLDSSVLKIWDKNNGKLYTSIEASTEFNNLCVVPRSGLLFLATENTKMQTYYIPSLGPAPRWASFLDSLTEELEENNFENVYDDYKFVTKQELENLGLDHLIGTNLLRAYMHGYFMDVRLYKKAKSVANPFEFEEYRKKKIRETIEKDRSNRVQVNKLPKVNKDLAIKLMNEENDVKKRKGGGSLLVDDRFKALFENPDFEVDRNTEEYRLLNPVLSRMDSAKKKQLKKIVSQEFDPVEEEPEGKASSDEESDYLEDDSSDDDRTWTEQMKEQYRDIQKERRLKEMQQDEDVSLRRDSEDRRQPKLFELRQGEEYKGIHCLKKKKNKLLNSVGNRELTFKVHKKKYSRADEKNNQHREERKRIDQDTDIEVCDICIVPESSTHLTVTTVLLYCKQKILNPYLRLLSFMGLRSLLNEREPSFCLRVFNNLYTATAILFMIMGYVLQYMSCFRRDRGFWYVITSDTRYTKTSVNTIFMETCEGSLVFTFVIPSILHFTAYLHAIYVFRSGDDEQLPVLMERVFLITTNLSSSFITQKKLVRTLWFYIIFSILWMISCFAVVNFMMTVGNIDFKWLEDNTTSSWGLWLMKILLVMCTLAHDMVQATIISNYCLQAELLTNYALFLKEKILQQSVVPLEWMRVRILYFNVE